jgi:hypothetical protein
MMRFKTFTPYTECGHVISSATIQLNEWLEENPGVEIISWQATPIGNPSELCITIQYKENK